MTQPDPLCLSTGQVQRDTISSSDSQTLLDQLNKIAQETSTAAVEEGRELMRRCIAMSKELRGVDILADRVRQLRRMLEQLETQVDLLLR